MQHWATFPNNILGWLAQAKGSSNLGINSNLGDYVWQLVPNYKYFGVVEVKSLFWGSENPGSTLSSHFYTFLYKYTF